MSNAPKVYGSIGPTDVMIAHPAEGAKYPPGVITAFGLAGSSIDGVSGVCENRTSGQEICTIPGKTIAFQVCKRAEKKQGLSHWVVKCVLTDPGEYVLRITGYEAVGDPVYAVRTFNVSSNLEVPQKVSRQPSDPPRIADPPTNIWPTPGLPLTPDEANNFNPSGTETSPMVAISLVDPDQNLIDPSSTFDDYQDLQYWTAHYPPLTVSGNYTLIVSDANGLSCEVQFSV
jgi:hypothetical protein